VRLDLTIKYPKPNKRLKVVICMKETTCSSPKEQLEKFENTKGVIRSRIP